jgi:hypothetical protein
MTPKMLVASPVREGSKERLVIAASTAHGMRNETKTRNNSGWIGSTRAINHLWLSILWRDRFTRANFHVVFELDDDLHTLSCGPLLYIVFRFCKRLRSQNFCGIYFVDATVYKIERHCTALGSKASKVWLCGRGRAPFRSCLHDEEGGFSCASHSSRLGGGAIPNRLWP